MRKRTVFLMILYALPVVFILSTSVISYGGEWGVTASIMFERIPLLNDRLYLFQNSSGSDVYKNFVFIYYVLMLVLIPVSLLFPTRFARRNFQYKKFLEQSWRVVIKNILFNFVFILIVVNAILRFHPSQEFQISSEYFPPNRKVHSFYFEYFYLYYSIVLFILPLLFLYLQIAAASYRLTRFPKFRMFVIETTCKG